MDDQLERFVARGRAAQAAVDRLLEDAAEVEATVQADLRRRAPAIGAPAWVYAMGRPRPGHVVKIGAARIGIRWTAPSSGVARVKTVRLDARGARRGWGLEGERPGGAGDADRAAGYRRCDQCGIRAASVQVEQDPTADPETGHVATRQRCRTCRQAAGTAEDGFDNRHED